VDGPEAAWATMPIADLMTLVQNEAGRLVRYIEQASIDEGAHQRAYWEHWAKLPADWGVTLASRDCELATKELDEQRRLAVALREGQQARFQALVTVLRARSS
jgi:hypothetical protein